MKKISLLLGTSYKFQIEKIILLLAIIILSSKTFAQVAELTKSPVSSSGDLWEINKIIGTTNDATYAYKIDRPSGSSSYYAELKKLNKTTLAVEPFKQKINSSQIKEYDYLEVEEIYMFNNNIYYLYSAYNKKTKAKDLRIMKLDQNSTFVDIKLNNEIYLEMDLSDYTKKNYFVFQSPDESKILVVNKFTKKNKDQLALWTIDLKTEQVLLKSDLIDKISNSEFYSYNYKVDNDGVAYFLACSTIGKANNPTTYLVKINDAGKSNLVYQIASKKGNLINKNLFEYNDKFAYKKYGRHYNETNYNISSANEILISSISREPAKGGKASLIIASIDKQSLKEQNYSEHFFDSKTDLRFKEIGSANKGSADKDYNIQDVIKLGNSVYVVGAVFHYEGTNNNFSHLTDLYDQFCFKLDGEKTEITLLPRNQRVIDVPIFNNLYLDVSSFYLTGSLPSKPDKDLKLKELPVGNTNSLSNTAIKGDYYGVVIKFSETEYKQNFIVLKGKENIVDIPKNILCNGQLLLCTASYNRALSQYSDYAYNLIKFK